MAEDLRYKQREAARRVRQTQEHNRQVFEQYSGHPAAEPAGSVGITPPPLYRSPPPPVPPLYARPPEPPRPAPPPPRPPAPAPTLDGEQWLLLGLALLLFRSGCRAELVVALLYLAM